MITTDEECLDSNFQILHSPNICTFGILTTKHRMKKELGKDIFKSKQNILLFQIND